MSVSGEGDERRYYNESAAMTDFPDGAELDALIAKEVMGTDVLGIILCTPEPDCCDAWSPAPCKKSDPGAELRPVGLYPFGCACDDDDDDDDPYPCPRRLGHAWPCLIVIPEYSVKIKHAWAAIEKLRELSIEATINSEGPRLWSVRTLLEASCDRDGYTLLSDVEGVSISRCICVAALLAVRKRNETVGRQVL